VDVEQSDIGDFKQMRRKFEKMQQELPSYKGRIAELTIDNMKRDLEAK
jgi:hypothetical protein